MTNPESHPLKHPDCWSDDIRMDALFSPFRLRKVNPENYDAKLKFWEDMMERYCDDKGSPCFTAREVRWAFQRKEKLPHGIETVVENLLSRKAIRVHTDFVNDPQNTWSGWLVKSLIRNPITWTRPSSQEPQDVPYIHLEMLNMQSKRLKKVLEQFSGSVVSFDRIAETTGHGLSKEGLFLNLLNLQSLEKVFLEYKIVDGQRRIDLVKVAEKGATAEPITDADKAVYALERTEEDLLKMMEEMESKAVNYEKLARENVRQGKRVVAKSYLRKKQKLLKGLDKHSKALENVQTMLGRIAETRDNELILDAYSIGSQTLQSLLTNKTLNMDNVDDVIDNIKESLEIHDEVEQSLASVQTVDKAEEQALEEELQGLLLDDIAPVVDNKEDNDKGPKAQPNSVYMPAANHITDEDILKHLDDLQIELGSPSTENIEGPSNLKL